AARAASENLELQYHYAYVLAQTGKGTEAREILSRVLATKRNFNGRSAAERLLADLGA
ncbi:MAG: tetratricopeptide repeat protein, partial [Steroidobacteraceae bacterium]